MLYCGGFQAQQFLFYLLEKKTIFSAEIEALRDVLRFHEYRYYVLNEPLLGDTDYDLLFKQLERLEQENPSLISKDSPTRRVGGSLNLSFDTIQHLVPMLSLENSYNAEDLLDWDESVRTLAGSAAVAYCAEPKFDGASISLVYENDLLVRAVPRGDGIAG